MFRSPTVTKTGNEKAVSFTEHITALVLTTMLWFTLRRQEDSQEKQASIYIDRGR